MNRKLLAISGILASLVCFYLPTLAQERYPARTVDVTVPFAAGGATDIAVRMVTEELQKILKVPFTVTNRAGGAGSIGAAYVAQAKKDGYLILGSTGPPIVHVPAITPNLPYDPIRDLTPSAHFVFAPILFAVREDAPWKSLEELISFAKKNPKKLTAGTPGTGSEPHFDLELLRSSAGVDIIHVPFKGGGEIVPALLGGHVDIAISTTSAFAGQIAARKVKALAITYPKRLSAYPDIPTMAEKGYPGVSVNIFLGFYAPSGTPKDVLDTLEGAIKKVTETETVMERAEKRGYIVHFMSGGELKRYIERETAVVRKVAKEAGMITK